MAIFKKKEKEGKGQDKKSQASLEVKETKSEEEKEEKKNEEKKEEEKPAKKKKAVKKETKTRSTVSDFNPLEVLYNPRITEKATDSAANGAYAFDVAPSANKKEIAKAIESVYGVEPAKVRTVKVPSKEVFARGRKGVKSGGKKAYVYLKDGDTIELI